MREHLEFLKISSAVVKVAAWIFLFLGVIGCAAIFFGFGPAGFSRWSGFVVLGFYTFFFFFFFLIAKIADLLIQIIHTIKKD